MNKAVSQFAVIADPKAIAARRNGGKIEQNVKAPQTVPRAKAWREEHGLDATASSKTPFARKGALS